jgi:translation initiation factor IF-3
MGREMQHRELGMALINKIKEKLADVADVEHNPSMLGNRLFLSLMPKKTA